MFDHMGQLPPSDGMRHPAFEVVRGLLAQREVWVKLSDACISSASGAPGYDDADEVAKTLIALASERLGWCSGWLQQTEAKDRKPDDAVLIDLLTQWVPDERLRRRVLVDNPGVLYGFA